jgi:hypothetical protein
VYCFTFFRSFENFDLSTSPLDDLLSRSQLMIFDGIRVIYVVLAACFASRNRDSDV